MNNCLFSLENINYSYSKTTPDIIKNLNMKIYKNDIVTILGKNGIGKTTLLKILTGQLKGYRGTIKIDDVDIRKINTRELSKKIGYVPSATSRYQDLSVMDYLVTGYANQLNLFQTPSDLMYEKAYEFLQTIGKEFLFKQNISYLSSGEMQLVNIGRVLLQNPNIIIFDEPTANLDINNQLLVIEKMKELSSKEYTLIMTSHNPGQALSLGGKTLLMSEDYYIFDETSKVLTAENLSRIYGLPVSMVKDENGKIICSKFESNGINKSNLYF